MNTLISCVHLALGFLPKMPSPKALELTHSGEPSLYNSSCPHKPVTVSLFVVFYFKHLPLSPYSNALQWLLWCTDRRQSSVSRSLTPGGNWRWEKTYVKRLELNKLKFPMSKCTIKRTSQPLNCNFSVLFFVFFILGGHFDHHASL